MSIQDTAAPYVARLAAGWTSRVGDARIDRRTGSLSSIDLSGFTRLSERLARHDPTGAEDLNSTISGQFTPLIDIAVAHGGDVLQFGGDALLIWYEDPGHERRAVAATWAMQRTIGERGRVDTPAGPVRLRMSAGIATGEVTFAVIGRTHRELLVLGPCATRTVQLESSAHAGQVMVSDATAAALPPGALRRVDDDAWLVRRRIDGGAPVEPAWPAAAGSDAMSFVPPEVRPIVMAGVAVAEHRPVTVCFTMVPGTDELVDDDVRLTAVLDAIESAADRAVSEFGVCWSATDIATDGFKLLFYAGAPLALGDDADRLVRAAVSIADRCVHLGPRIGVSTGLAFAADLGHPDRRAFAIIGDTVNLAARLCGRSEAARPLVSMSTIEACRSSWDTGEVRSMQVKGKTTLVHATEVTGESAGWGHRAAAPLFGRERELAQLTSMIEHGERRSVEVVGPAGIGKSLLVRHAIAAARSSGQRVIECAGAAVRSRTPHAALIESFPQLHRAEGDPSEPLDLDDAVSRRDAVHAEIVAELIGEMTPTMLVVEDTHWLDEASRSFLQQLVAATNDLAWTIVLTRRPEGPSMPTEEVVELTGLELNDLLLLAVPAHGSGWLEADLIALRDAVDGNPLFFTEAVRRRRGTFELRAGSRSIELLSQRLDELPPQVRRAVRSLAVVGRPLPIAVWSEIADQHIDVAHLRQHRHVIAELDGDWWLTSEPLVELAEAGFARRDRQKVHGRAATVLERHRTDRSISTAELALHHHRAGNRVESWTMCRLAAAQARAAGSLRDAAELLQMAVTLIDETTPAEESDRAAHELAEVLIAIGRFDEADRLLRDAWRHLGRTAPVAAMLLRARAAEQDGRYVAANRFLRRAVDDPTCTETDHIDAALLAGLVAHHQGRRAVAERQCWNALHSARRSGDHRRRAQAHLQLVIIRWAQGSASVERHQACAEALFRRAGDGRGLGLLLLNRGGNRILDGRWTDALADCDEARTVLERAGYLIDAAVAEMNANLIRVRRGEVDEALRRASVIARTFRGLGWAEGVAYLDVTVAAAASQAERHDDALARLDEAEAVFERTHNLDFLGETRRQRAVCELRRRRPDEALAALASIDTAWFEHDPVLEVGVDWVGGHAALQLGDHERAEVLLRRAAARAEQRSLSYDLANVAWSLEQLADVTGSADGGEWRSLRLELFASLDVGDALPPLPV